jgi:hypothetical protein
LLAKYFSALAAPAERKQVQVAPRILLQKSVPQAIHPIVSDIDLVKRKAVEGENRILGRRRNPKVFAFPLPPSKIMFYTQFINVTIWLTAALVHSR